MISLSLAMGAQKDRLRNRLCVVAIDSNL